ncbi:MAG: type II toxin-antitoxin system RelE/ParE family toxin [Trinickia sp.]|uniref:type II toxin-antitoxin system RelE/ParE family toxin n=1 Tax=Trinickia sp. TaxID=2571163 RepID=UPI003F7FE1CA
MWYDCSVPSYWFAHGHSRSRARVLFTVIDDKMVLLHGFIKKSQQTPTSDLKLARTRMRQAHDAASAKQSKESPHGKQARRK